MDHHRWESISAKDVTGPSAFFNDDEEMAVFGALPEYGTRFIFIKEENKTQPASWLQILA